MSREYNKIKLFDIEKAVFVDAFLYNDIIDKNIDDFENEWIPLFNSSKTKLKKLKIIIEDAQWDWNYNSAIRDQILAYEKFALEANSKTQGMMIINSTNYTSRIEKGMPLIYIEYLAVAPWNRKILVTKPKYKLVGSLLLHQAIGESFEKGFKGRIGLHSLPGAVDWYTQKGLINFGIDKERNLPYMELKKEIAVELFAKLKQ